MLNHGISWEDVTWRNRTITRLTKPTSKRCIVTPGTPLSGARSASCTTRLTRWIQLTWYGLRKIVNSLHNSSIGMLWMLTAVLSVLIHTSVKYGMILALCTSPATTKYKTLWMHINERQIWTRQTRISSNDWNYCVNRNLFNPHKCKDSNRLLLVSKRFLLTMLIDLSAGSAPAPHDVSNPNQYQNGPGSQPLNGVPFNQVHFCSVLIDHMSGSKYYS